MMEQFFKRYYPLPENRGEIAANLLPICQTDIRHLAQVYGEDVAENIRIVAQEVRRRGGINPQAVELIVPEGKDGPLDERQLFRTAGNLATWWTQTDANTRY